MPVRGDTKDALELNLLIDHAQRWQQMKAKFNV